MLEDLALKRPGKDGGPPSAGSGGGTEPSACAQLSRLAKGAKAQNETPAVGGGDTTARRRKISSRHASARRSRSGSRPSCRTRRGSRSELSRPSPSSKAARTRSVRSRSRVNHQWATGDRIFGRTIVPRPIGWSSAVPKQVPLTDTRRPGFTNAGRTGGQCEENECVSYT